MIWLTWRQYRIEAVVGILTIVFLGIVFLNSGFTMYTTYQNMGLVACATRPCDNQIGYAFMGRTFDLASTISSFLQPWLCLFVAVFIGAPLVAREREQRTLPHLDTKHHAKPLADSQARFDCWHNSVGLCCSCCSDNMVGCPPEYVIRPLASV